eukprot:590428-Rhodomonas_salina.1
MVDSPTSLRASYALPTLRAGTDAQRVLVLAYSAYWYRHASRAGTDIQRVLVPGRGLCSVSHPIQGQPIRLRVSYAISGTDPAYDATR